MNAGSSLEAEILKSITNTLGIIMKWKSIYIHDENPMLWTF